MRKTYPLQREVYFIKINPKSDSNLEDGREKSSTFQNIYAGGGSYKTPGGDKSRKII